jgi:ABC-type bacteriocin/lantibiotic exporter with double-glycine peptidase domain
MHLLKRVAFIIFLTGCATVSRFQMDGGTSFDSIRQRHISDCGLVSLVAVMNYWGISVDLQEAEKELGRAPQGGYSLGDLKQYAEKKGLIAVIMPGTIEILSHHTSLGRPCIIVYRRNQDSNHSVVVLKVYDSDEEPVKLKIMDPVFGRIRSVSGKWLTERWEPLGYPVLLVAKGQSQE